MIFKFDPTFEARSLHMPGEDLLALDHIESQLKWLLPPELRDLFKQFGSMIVFDQSVEFEAPDCIYSDKNGRIALSAIFGPESGETGILGINEAVGDQIPEDKIVFGDIGLGNMLLIDRNTQAVSVWLHDEALPSRAITPITPTFRDFLDLLFMVESPPLRSLKELGLDLKAMGLEED